MFRNAPVQPDPTFDGGGGGGMAGGNGGNGGNEGGGGGQGTAGVATRTAPYFTGRRRMACVLVQGQFKHRVSFEDAMTGQAFERPLAHMPNKLLLRAGMGKRRGEIN